MDTPAQRASLFASLLLHAGLLYWSEWWPEEKGEEILIELALVAPGSPGNQNSEPEISPHPETPIAAKPTPRPAAPKAAPMGRRAPAPEPAPAKPAPAPANPTPTPPQSFQDWQRSRRSAMFGGFRPSAGALNGHDAITRHGRDRCEPLRTRDVDIVIVLYDASGSLTPMGKSQALSCGTQAARHAIEAGGKVVVGTFANGAFFTEPTDDFFEVQAALRTFVDPRGSVLPARQLDRYLSPDKVAELVIVSDGWVEISTESLIWYRYFLEMNRENRGRMFTVGNPGRREAVHKLRNIGFDVYMYSQIRTAR